MAVVDVREVHKVVEDTDRFDTSQGGTSLTIECRDSGELALTGEYNNSPGQWTIPNVPRPYFLFFQPDAQQFVAVRNLDDVDGSWLVAAYVKDWL